MIQQTGYPWNGKVSVKVNPETKSVITLKLRIPGWAVNCAVPGDLYRYINESEGKVVLKVNGKEEKIDVNKGYAAITKEWNKGDEVELVFPMTVQRVIANENAKDYSGQVAFEYGLIVYCAEEIDNKGIANIAIANNPSLSVEEKTILY